MLKLYHSPTSPNSRRVWIALLEKGLEFELIEVKLDGEQFSSKFIEINPFHHVPVLVDDDFRIVESLAILDYLEAKYPIPALMPSEASVIARVKMVAMITVNELMPAIAPLFPIFLGLPIKEPEKLEIVLQKVSTVLTFLEGLLGNNPYFGGENLSLAEIVAGSVIPQLPSLNISFKDHPKLNVWCKGLMKRTAWIITQPSLEALEAVKIRHKAILFG